MQGYDLTRLFVIIILCDRRNELLKRLDLVSIKTRSLLAVLYILIEVIEGIEVHRHKRHVARRGVGIAVDVCREREIMLVSLVGAEYLLNEGRGLARVYLGLERHRHLNIKICPPIVAFDANVVHKAYRGIVHIVGDPLVIRPREEGELSAVDLNDHIVEIAVNVIGIVYGELADEEHRLLARCRQLVVDDILGLIESVFDEIGIRGRQLFGLLAFKLHHREQAVIDARIADCIAVKLTLAHNVGAAGVDGVSSFFNIVIGKVHPHVAVISVDHVVALDDILVELVVVESGDDEVLDVEVGGRRRRRHYLGRYEALDASKEGIAHRVIVEGLVARGEAHRIVIEKDIDRLVRKRIFAEALSALVERIHLGVVRVDALVSDVISAVRGYLVSDYYLVDVALKVCKDVMRGDVMIGLARSVDSVAFDKSVSGIIYTAVGQALGCGELSALGGKGVAAVCDECGEERGIVIGVLVAFYNEIAIKIGLVRGVEVLRL